jgi:hypothetical protein
MSALCDRAILLERGRLVESGPVDDVLKTYHAQHESTHAEFRRTTSALRWRGIQNRNALDGLRGDQDLVFELAFESGQEPISNMQIDIALVDENDCTAVHCRSKFVQDPISVPANTSFVVRYMLRSPHLAPGRYRLTVYAATHLDVLFWVEQIDACSISAKNPFLSDSVLDGVKGVIVPDFSVNLHLNSEHVAIS